METDPVKKLLIFDPLSNFTVHPHTKAVATNTSKPVLTIKIPIVNMSYSDHTKLCLSFCALHPDCALCSAFPDEYTMVVPDQDKVIGPAGHNGTLFCLLFIRSTSGASDWVGSSLVFGAVTYVSAGVTEVRDGGRPHSPGLFEKKLG